MYLERIPGAGDLSEILERLNITTWLSFLFACHLLFITSTPKLVVSRNFLSIRIVLSCFYQLFFYFEIFSTWIWRLPYAWSFWFYGLSGTPAWGQWCLSSQSLGGVSWSHLRFSERKLKVIYIFFYRLGLLIREMCKEIRTKKTKCRHTVLKTEFHFNISRAI